MFFVCENILLPQVCIHLLSLNVQHYTFISPPDYPTLQHCEKVYQEQFTVATSPQALSRKVQQRAKPRNLGTARGGTSAGQARQADERPHTANSRSSRRDHLPSPLYYRSPYCGDVQRSYERQDRTEFARYADLSPLIREGRDR